jgi:hypothetical protein
MTTIGRRGPSELAPADDLAPTRVMLARANRQWREIPADRLVPRELRLLVDAETDLVYQHYRGAI